jgi:hypothetical protein
MVEIQAANPTEQGQLGEEMPGNEMNEMDITVSRDQD